MNSRLENGSPAWESKDALIAEIHQWLAEGEISSIYDETDTYISYESYDGLMYAERRLYFEEYESVDSILDRMCYDEKVLDYIDPIGVASFIYNCIDINAISAVKAIALIYNDAIIDEYEDVEGYEPSAARSTLEAMVAGAGCDSYAYEVGFQDGEPTLGITWEERSAVVINIDAVWSSSKAIANDYAADYGTSWKIEITNIFREALVQTLCHEFRHAVYDLNELIPCGESPDYPADGGLEDYVEEYGNAEAARLLSDGASRTYINAMFV